MVELELNFENTKQQLLDQESFVRLMMFQLGVGSCAITHSIAMIS